MALKLVSAQTGQGRAPLIAERGFTTGTIESDGRASWAFFFQLPIPGFRPFVVFGPEANRKILVTERNKVLWRNTDPVTDLLRRGVLVVDGEEHDHYRELMEPPLHPSQLSNYTQMMIDQTDRVSSSGRAAKLLICWWKAAKSHC